MDRRSELVDVIRDVRNRWRKRLAVRGLVVVVTGTILALLLGASGLETLRFSVPAIISFRIIALAVFLGLLYLAFVKPMRRRVTDSQVAMYLEESNPRLEAAIISAIETSKLSDAGEAEPSASPQLVEKLVQQAIEQCREIDHRQSADHVAFRRHALSLVAVGVAAALIVALGPAYLRHGLSALLIVSRSAEAASPYKIRVTPGDAKVPKGGDQIVRATLMGFASRDVGIMMRTDPGGSFERVPLIPSTTEEHAGGFEGVLFHLEKPIEYYVESNGVLSPKFRLEVVDLPTVQQLDLEYRFPAYTGLQPRKVDGGGDVAAIRGTDVLLTITPTMKAPSGRIVLNDGNALPLTVQGDGTLTGSFAIKQQGYYKIELTGPHGEKVDASPQYTIDVIDDQAPSVRFSKPGRDSQASPVEELFLEARADDDYGVKQLQLFYSANGAPPKAITLFGGPKPLAEVSAGHTIYLEELGLKPGDFVSYYAKATDTDSIAGPKTATSDIYFVQIRPFRKDYKPAQSQAMGGGGGGGQNSVGQLSQQQREIVAATFNAVRDKAKTKPEKYPRERRVPEPGAGEAARPGGGARRQARSTPRQRGPGLRQDRADAAKSRRGNEVRRGRAEGDEGGRSAVTRAAGAEDPAGGRAAVRGAGRHAAGRWRRRRWSERDGRGPRGSVRARTRQAREPVRDAEPRRAAEQRPADRRARRKAEGAGAAAAAGNRASTPPGAAERQLGGGGGASQRQLAEELEKAQRQLQQLTREQQQQQNVADAMRRMQEAADAMKRAAANGSKDGGAQADRSAGEAARRAAEARTRSVRSRPAESPERAAAGRRARGGTEADAGGRQRRSSRRAPAAPRRRSSSGSARTRWTPRSRTCRSSSRSSRIRCAVTRSDGARKLDEAAGSIRDKRIREMLRYSRNQLNTPGRSTRAEWKRA